jgi:hypoxanthine phosphoribosyltransferase
MKSIKINDLIFDLYLDSDRIQAAVKKLAASMNHDLAGKEVVFLVILNGSFLFAADLIRQIDFNCRISFLKLSSYNGIKNGEPRILIGLIENLKDKTVVIIEDIIDTGNTLDLVIRQIREEEPAELQIAALLMKHDAYEYTHKIDYVCFRIPNQFVVGYGLDYDGFGRNLNSIYTVVQ